MTVRFKTFTQILMAVLALGMSSPQPVCAAGTSEVEKNCCCSGGPVCKCHPGTPTKQSCVSTPVQVFDKQLPGRIASVSSLHGNSLLFSIAPTEFKYLVLVSATRHRDLDASPPFGSSPPQAMLCLWLI